MKRAILNLLIIVLIMGVSMKIKAAGYEEPDQKLVKIYDIPPLPYINFSNFENIAFEKEYTRDIRLKNLVREEIGLAGEAIHPSIFGYWDNYPITRISRIDLNTNEKKHLNLPEGIEIRSTELSWDRTKLAIISQKDAGIYLGIYDLEKDRYTEMENLLLNDILGSQIQWFNDNRHLLVLSVDKDAEKPAPSEIPLKPVIEETMGKTSQTRTYTNLLKDAYDEELFEYYFTSQPVIVDAKKMKYRKIAEPGIFSWLDLSPDNRYFISAEVRKPWSRELPWYRFPRTYNIRDLKGEVVHVLYERPLMDEVPIGGVYQGPRGFEWHSGKDASVIWREALDDGDPKKEVAFRDKVILLADVNGTPEEILKTENRFQGIDWSDQEDWFIYYDYDRDTYQLRGWLRNLETAEEILIEDRNIRDKYNDPGDMIRKRNEYNNSVFMLKNRTVWYKNSQGATPEGRFPYIKKVNLIDNSEEIVFQSREGFLEVPVCFIDKEMTKIAVSSQNQENPRNYYLYDTQTGERDWITSYKNPYPEWAKMQKEVVYYEREDGVKLSATLYLPPDHKGKDRLPLVINAYPEEYTNSSTAGQSSKTADSFTYFSGASVRYFALAGYAVLAGASIPIIGDPETVNETFISQTVSSVQAAVDYLDERGIIDPARVGITGHSYGAFMVANVLANSDICAAGIARSGAYNRTLTPFGFQSERRTFWEAKDFYLQVSPFMHADKINQPILLIHGEEDDNSGTYPLQTRRFYSALKGNGAIAKMVILPLEHHGYRARESNLLVIKEMIDWFDKYVKK